MRVWTAKPTELRRVANEPRFADVPPARIVPALADEGVYIASESTFARGLRQHRQSAHRGRAKAPRAVRPPTTHVATAPRQIWCWDMTCLPAVVLGRWFHLYLILDLYSRKIVGWEVHDTDDADHAAHLVRRTALAERHCCAESQTHPAWRQWGHAEGDHGAGNAALARCEGLVLATAGSDDNAFAEALFGTANYRPEFPAKGFADLQAARTWASAFVHWYNFQHRHSGIRYVSPAQRHAGEHRDIHAARHALYIEARERNPGRWSRNTRNWNPVGAATPNPERDSVVNMVSEKKNRSALAT